MLKGVYIYVCIYIQAQIPATKLQEHRFLQQETLFMLLQNIQMFYKARHFGNPPAHIAAIRPFLLSWSFKMSFTAADCTKKHHKSLFGVGYLKHGWKNFLKILWNRTCFIEKTNWHLPTPPQDRGQWEYQEGEKLKPIHTCPRRKEEGNQKELQQVLDPHKSWLTHAHRKLFENVTRWTGKSIHKIHPVSLCQDLYGVFVSYSRP